MKDKNVILKIIGSQPGIDGDFDETELVTEGKLYEKDGSIYVMYEESEISGLEGYKTRLKINKDKVRLHRYDDDDANSITSLEFEKGKRSLSTYNTPYGDIAVELLTNDIRNDLSEEGYGTVNVDYHISLRGLMDTRNILNLEIMRS